MALNIKDPEAEALAAQVAELAHENKTEAVRVALRERLERLQQADGSWRRKRLTEFLETQVWPLIPDQARAPRTTQEEDDVLGFGPAGY